MTLYASICLLVFLVLIVSLEGRTFVDMLVKTFFIAMSFWSLLMLMS